MNTTTIILGIAAIMVSIIIYLKTRKNESETSEIITKIQEFKLLISKLEKGDKNTKKEAMRMLYRIHKLLLIFIKKYSVITKNTPFSANSIKELNEIASRYKELIDRYKNNENADKRMLYTISKILKDIHEQISQKLLEAYKYTNRHLRPS